MWIDQLKVPVNFSEGAETWLKPSWLLLASDFWLVVGQWPLDECVLQVRKGAHAIRYMQAGANKMPLARCLSIGPWTNTIVTLCQVLQKIGINNTSHCCLSFRCPDIWAFLFMSNLILLVLSQFLFNPAWDRCLAIHHLPTLWYHNSTVLIGF